MKKILIPAAILAVTCFVPACRSHTHNISERSDTTIGFDSMVAQNRYATATCHSTFIDSLSALIDSPVIMCITRDSANGRMRLISFSAKQITLGHSQNQTLSLVVADTMASSVNFSSATRSVIASTDESATHSESVSATRLAIAFALVTAAIFATVYTLRRRIRQAPTFVSQR